MNKKRILSEKALIRKELKWSDFKYRLYRISYFGMIGGMTLMMLIITLNYSNKLYLETFFKSFFVLSIIIIVCGIYFITYYSWLDKWYSKYQKEQMEITVRERFWKDVENGKYPNFKIVKE